MYRELFENLRDQEISKGDVVILELDSLEGDIAEILLVNKIEFDELITFNQNDKVIKTSVKSAYTCFYMLGGKSCAAVFIPKEMYSVDQDVNDAMKYVAIVHEIAHVKDFRNCIYINWKTKESNLLKAEVYAEITTIKFLSRDENDSNKVCRSIYAQRLVDFQNDDCELNREVYKGVIKKYPLKKLNQWAKSKCL